MRFSSVARTLILSSSFGIVLAGGPSACASADVRSTGLPAATDMETALYSQHLFTLANEFMQGRKPGTKGIEKAAQYIEFHFDRLGLEPAFEDEGGAATWRQPFRIGETSELVSQSMAMSAGGQRTEFASGVDFNALAYGSAPSSRASTPPGFVTTRHVSALNSVVQR